MTALKWLKSDLGQTSLVLWFFSLGVLVLMHILHSTDPWDRVTFHPAFLAVMPLLVASVPWLYTKPASGDARNRRGDTARSALILWISSLVIFTFPLRLRNEYWAPVVHNPIFLALAPVLIAGIALIRPLPIAIRTDAPPRPATLMPNQISSGIVACILAVLLLIGLLYLFNNRSFNVNHAPVLWPNLIVGSALAAAILRLRYLLRLRIQNNAED